MQILEEIVRNMKTLEKSPTVSASFVKRKYYAFLKKHGKLLQCDETTMARFEACRNMRNYVSFAVCLLVEFHLHAAGAPVSRSSSSSFSSSS